MKTDQLNTVFVIESLGIGGMQKNLVMLAEALRKAGAKVHIVALKTGGEYEAYLKETGIPYTVAPDEASIRTIFEANGTKLLYFARGGQKNRHFSAIIKLAKDTGIITAEHNIFGHVDKSGDEANIDLHMLLSRSQIGKYAAKIRLNRLEWSRFAGKITILPNIVTQTRYPMTQEEARTLLDIPKDAFVVGSVCRPDLEKFGRKALEAWKRSKNSIPNFYPIVRSLPPELETEFKAAFGDRCKILEKTLDEKLLAATYQSMDVFFNFARIGESFGIAILEAMAFGLPVVVDKKDRFMSFDNTQLEHVAEAKSGFIIDHVNEVPDVLGKIHTAEKSEREKFRARAKAHAQKFTDEKVIEELEAIVTAFEAKNIVVRDQNEELSYLYRLLFPSKGAFILKLLKTLLGSSYPFKALSCFGHELLSAPKPAADDRSTG